MLVTAKLNGARISARKVRRVADQIRSQPVSKALNCLTFSHHKSAVFIGKVLNSAIANAESQRSADVDTLRVHRVYVNEGKTMKRIRYRARGRADRVLKRSCHITIVLDDGEE